jgi:hypothetical protein
MRANNDGARYRHNATANRSPESNDKALVRVTENDKFIAGLHATSL